MIKSNIYPHIQPIVPSRKRKRNSTDLNLSDEVVLKRIKKNYKEGDEIDEYLPKTRVYDDPWEGPNEVSKKRAKIRKLYKPSHLPAVEIPHPGLSYNPPKETHIELLKRAAKEFQTKEARLKHYERQLKAEKITNWHPDREADPIFLDDDIETEKTSDSEKEDYVALETNMENNDLNHQNTEISEKHNEDIPKEVLKVSKSKSVRSKSEKIQRPKLVRSNSEKIQRPKLVRSKSEKIQRPKYIEEDTDRPNFSKIINTSENNTSENPIDYDGIPEKKT